MVALRIACLSVAVTAVLADVCVPGHHGPVCHDGADCANKSGCLRCAASGFCTNVPLPGPNPPHPHPPHQEGCTVGNPSFDFLLLVEAWPPTNCLSSHCTESYAKINDRFTLHGFWPSRGGQNAASYPCNCDDRRFDPSALEDFLNEMNQDWPSFKPDSDQFWEHEWSKHGTCCAHVANLSTQQGYFKTTLDLRRGHAILPGLARAGITPSDIKQYKAADIIEVLKPVGEGHRPTIGCIQKDRVQYLNEVAFCLDRNLTFIQCDVHFQHLPHDEVSDCDHSKDITIPTGGHGEATTLVI